MSQERQTEITIILGFRGTGKTTLIKELIKAEINAGGRALIVMTDDIEYQEYQFIHPKFDSHLEHYKTARKVIYFDDELIKKISKHYSNGLLVFDDCRSFLTANTHQLLHKLVIRSRQKAFDIIFAAHGFTEVPPKLFTFATQIILFKTRDNIYKRKGDLLEFEKMAKAQIKVNEAATKNPHIYTVIQQ